MTQTTSSRLRGSPRLVVTLGPSTEGNIVALRQAGATDFRLDAAHMYPAMVRELASLVEREAPDAACIVDLQGAKMRLGEFEPRRVQAGELVRLLWLRSGARPEQGMGIPVPHSELFRAVGLGDELSIADGRVRLKVLRASSDEITAEVTQTGMLESRKGLDRTTHPLELADFGSHDLEVLAACAGFDHVQFAISFVRDGDEATWLRSRYPDCRVVLKIERQEALDALDAVARRADELWLCRGDLGAQLGLGPMARAMHGLDPRRFSVPLLMAGQVFEHLKDHAEPTRSEVCHLHDLLARGFAGIVLSDETALGAHPVRATRTVAALLRELHVEQPASCRP